jgi:hypothetical protein
LAGVKGKSGRKSFDKEFDVQRLWILSKTVLIDALQASDEDVTRSQKIDIAKTLIQKMIPQDVKHSGKLEFSLADKLKEARLRTNVAE